MEHDCTPQPTGTPAQGAPFVMLGTATRPLQRALSTAKGGHQAPQPGPPLVEPRPTGASMRAGVVFKEGGYL